MRRGLRHRRTIGIERQSGAIESARRRDQCAVDRGLRLHAPVTRYKWPAGTSMGAGTEGKPPRCQLSNIAVRIVGVCILAETPFAHVCRNEEQRNRLSFLDDIAA